MEILIFQIVLSSFTSFLFSLIFFFIERTINRRTQRKDTAPRINIFSYYSEKQILPFQDEFKKYKYIYFLTFQASLEDYILNSNISQLLITQIEIEQIMQLIRDTSIVCIGCVPQEEICLEQIYTQECKFFRLHTSVFSENSAVPPIISSNSSPCFIFKKSEQPLNISGTYENNPIYYEIGLIENATIAPTFKKSKYKEK